MGRYVLVTPLARGGMAQIWLARQPGLHGFEKVVAIKRMIGGLDGNEEYERMFLTEARLAAQLNHANIVQILDLGQHDGSYYIVMEYLEGESLATLKRLAKQENTPLPDALLARLLTLAAAGLQAAHTAIGLDGKPLGIVHRDVSPQNLVVSADGSLKVVDFGIAKASEHTTKSGKLKGKAAYMAPEQALGEAVDARTDVYALGVVAFELFSDGRLFPGMTDLEVLRLVAARAPLPRLIDRRPGVSPQLDELVTRAMAWDPANRFQSARELELALEDFIHALGRPATTSHVAEVVRGLLSARLQEKRRLIETALSSDLSPHSLQQLAKLQEPSSSSSVSQPVLPTVVLPPGGPGAPAAPRPVEVRESDVTFSRKRAGPVIALLFVALAVAVASLVGFALRAQLPWAQTAAAPAPAPPPLARAAVRVQVQTDPPSAQLLVDGADVGGAGARTLEIAPGEHLLEARGEGLLPTKRVVVVAADAPTQFVLTLAPAPGAAPPPVAAATTPAPQAAPPRRAQRGRLSLQTTPWTTVTLGARTLGDTPLIDVELPAGRHLLKLKNAEAHVDETIEVEIRAGQATVKSLKL